jgi:hypothetical protein
MPAVAAVGILNLEINIEIEAAAWRAGGLVGHSAWRK